MVLFKCSVLREVKHLFCFTRGTAAHTNTQIYQAKWGYIIDFYCSIVLFIINYCYIKLLMTNERQTYSIPKENVWFKEVKTHFTFVMWITKRNRIFNERVKVGWGLILSIRTWLDGVKWVCLTFTFAPM